MNDSGQPYSVKEELKFKNSLRQLEFMSSSLVEDSEIFKKTFHLPSYHDSTLVIRGYKEPEREWNTPSAFRPALRNIKRKVDQELQDWHKIRKLDNKHRPLNQIEINKYILKRNCLEQLLSVLIRKMEQSNDFLQNGIVKVDDFDAESSGLDALGSLFLFLENAYLTPSSEKGKPKQVFNLSIVQNLIDSLYEAIENVEVEEKVSNTQFHCSKDRSILILNAQRKFLKSLFHYYRSFYRDEESTLAHSDRIQGFIEYMPFNESLSSGENALLNLFSRLYSFIQGNLISENAFIKPSNHYILLLDEGDLGFHPQWKKGYLNVLVNTVPLFFEKLDASRSIEIIFTTHDPLALSDLPNSNVVYIERPTYSEKSAVLEKKNPNRPQRTFGANITDLLTDSFFITGGLTGDFAKSKIHECIDWLNSENLDNSAYYRKMISLIDEPIVERKLAEMYDSKMNENAELAAIRKQIKYLQDIEKKHLK